MGKEGRERKGREGDGNERGEGKRGREGKVKGRDPAKFRVFWTTVYL